MTYLYAAMGIAMLSSVFAILQLADNLNSISRINYQKLGQYYESLTAIPFDKNSLSIINGETSIPSPSENICEYILEDEKWPDYSMAEPDIYSNRLTSSDHDRFSNVCVMENLKEKHRVLINRKNDIYNYYSCIIKTDNKECDFE